MTGAAKKMEECGSDWANTQWSREWHGAAALLPISLDHCCVSRAENGAVAMARELD